MGKYVILITALLAYCAACFVIVTSNERKKDGVYKSTTANDR